MANTNQKVREEILNAISKNIPIVSSAGNIGEELFYPASEEKVFSVIARDINNVDVAFSNKGTKKSFSCPGVRIKIDNDHYVSGTSFACSFLTGTIALIKENKSDYTLEDLNSVLIGSCIDGNKYSYGLIQLDRIVIK